ncbi:flagellin N-terminal helical region, partial [Clostridium cavendishii DSM 21758]
MKIIEALIKIKKSYQKKARMPKKLKFKEEFIMIINHNMNAMNASRQMEANNVAAGKSIEKLSSGLRINKAGDDAAGLAISEKMRGQIRGLQQAS